MVKYFFYAIEKPELFAFFKEEYNLIATFPVEYGLVFIFLKIEAIEADVAELVYAHV